MLAPLARVVAEGRQPRSTHFEDLVRVSDAGQANPQRFGNVRFRGGGYTVSLPDIASTSAPYRDFWGPDKGFGKV